MALNLSYVWTKPAPHVVGDVVCGAQVASHKTDVGGKVINGSRSVFGHRRAIFDFCPVTQEVAGSSPVAPAKFPAPDLFRADNGRTVVDFQIARQSPMRQKQRKRKSLALPSTFSRIAASGSSRAISIAPIIVEKIAKNARSLSTIRRPGMNGTIRVL